MGNGFIFRPRATAVPSAVEFPLSSEEPVLSLGAEAGADVAHVEKFPERLWDPDWRCWLVVAEFAATDWRSAVRVEDPPDAAATKDEIRLLLKDAQQRPAALAEITAQHQGFLAYFDAVSMSTPEAYPATALLQSIAMAVGQLVVTDLKAKYNRARPSQIAPGLVPPFRVPGHPAYPSGHAMQSHLVAHAMARLRPDLSTALFALADRITRNREISGFHFPSDGAAGKLAAQQAYDVLSGLPGYNRFLSDAAGEWQ